MYANTGYHYETDVDKDEKELLIDITSCGNYWLRTMPFLNTTRPNGRRDYQIMYVASGNVYCMDRESEQVAPAGSLILFPPGFPQNYTYYREEQPEVYWVHFSGSDAKRITDEVFGGSGAVRIAAVGISPEYPYLYLQIIRELQVQNPCFEDLISLYLREILLLAKRAQSETSGTDRKMKREIEAAVRYFNENYSEPVHISEYAKSQNMSTCWFIRSFRQYTGMPPLQYLTRIRVAKAASLLESTDYNIGEIGTVVGYENPLYFSRIFKKQTGCSPAEYRRRRLGKLTSSGDTL